MLEAEERKLLEDTHRLAQENNKMLRAMRRAGWIRLILYFIFYAAIIAAPIWFYFAYLNGAVQNLLQTYDRLEGRNPGAQQQTQQTSGSMNQFEAWLKSLQPQSKPPTGGAPSQ